MSGGPSRSVLMVSYAFPPEAYVGGRRTLKYCKYLGAFGWRPIVVTIRPRADAFQDEALSRQLPADAVVVRTRDCDTVKWVEALAAWARPFRRPRRGAAPAVPDAAARGAGTPRAAGWFARLKDALIRTLLASPDSHVGWAPFAFVAGARVLLTTDVDVIYSTSPPHSSHLTAFLLATCFRKPHVVDFRDPWVTAGAVQARLKRLIVRHAARVVVVSPGEPDELRAEVAPLEMRRVAVLTNGFDPEDFAADPGRPDPAHVSITHAGTIYRDTGRDFFDAIERLLAADPGLRAVLRVNLVGDLDPEHRDTVARLVAAGVVRLFGMQPHQAALALMRRSHALLLLQRGGTSASSHIPAKLFEYLFLGKPILAIAGAGTTRDILTASGLGVVVPPRDVAALAAAIERLCRDVRSGHGSPRPDGTYISQFDRRALTGRFANLLEEAARDA